MPDVNKTSLTQASGEIFYAIGRAPERSQPRIVVEHTQGVAAFTLDVATGDPGYERVRLMVTRPGTFTIPALVAQGVLLSIRGRKLPPGAVTATILWDGVN